MNNLKSLETKRKIYSDKFWCKILVKIPAKNGSVFRICFNKNPRFLLQINFFSSLHITKFLIEIRQHRPYLAGCSEFIALFNKLSKLDDRDHNPTHLGLYLYFHRISLLW